VYGGEEEAPLLWGRGWGGAMGNNEREGRVLMLVEGERRWVPQSCSRERREREELEVLEVLTDGRYRM